jgi:hypothetical protein
MSGSSRSVESATKQRSFPYRSGLARGSSTTGSAPLPCFPVLSATSCSNPQPEHAHRRRQQHRQLVAPGVRRRADERAEFEAGVLMVLLTASLGHVAAAAQQVADRRADERGRDEAEERQRREPAADVGRVHERVA